MKYRSFSLTDVVILFALGLATLSIMLIRVQSDRAAARNRSCENNLKQLGLAFHNYHSAYKTMPMGSGGTDTGGVDDPMGGNASRLSYLVGLTPFLEEQALWEKIANPLRNEGVVYPAMGPVPWLDPNAYTPWGQRPALFVCPTDPDAETYQTASSYTVNYGDGILAVGAPVGKVLEPYADDLASKRGIVTREQFIKFRDILDGLSNTLLLSEAKMGGPKVAKGVDGLPLDPSICVTAREVPGTQFWPAGRNACWADGSLLSSGFQTVLPPNFPSATSTAGELEGVMSASSHHLAGVHVLFADGAVRFVTNKIDAGNSQSASVATPRDLGYTLPGSESPYGLWGAMGTRAAKELVDREDENIVDPPRELDAAEIAEVKKRPLRAWTLADGETKLSARLVEIRRESHVILLTEADETKSIALSALHSDDAYFAVQTVLAERKAARESLKKQLQSGLAMLEKKQFKEFIDLFMIADEQGELLTQVLPLQRGIFIQIFDVALHELSSPTPSGMLSSDPSGDQFEVRGGRSAGLGRLKFVRLGERWKITF